jgi:hypothetical protein
MEKIKMFFGAHKVLKVIAWVFLVVLGLYVILVAVRVVHFFNQDKIDAAVLKIHNTKLTLDDVMGKNLPPDPGALADATVQGIDANNNGIRDDVELAVFKAYPNSAKTRAVLLQYALTLQMEVAQSTMDTTIATALAEEESRGFDCVGNIVKRGSGDLEILNSYINFIKNLQINTQKRKESNIDFNNKVRSYELQSGCDIDLKTLPN